MTDVVKEQLSACLDGELSRAELELLLQRMRRETELRADPVPASSPPRELAQSMPETSPAASLHETLSRYALASEALKGERPAAASRDFAARVMGALEAEPPLARPASRIAGRALRRLRPVAGVAVAASVAALALFSVQRLGVLTPTATVAEQEPIAPAATDTVELANPSYVVPSSISPAAFAPPATRLTNYVVAHSEYSSPLGRRSVLTGVLAEDDASPDVAPAEPETLPATLQPQER